MYPKAAKALATESDKLMTHFEVPAEHWKHLRTTDPIESTFATVKLRQRVTKGAGSPGAGLAMADRLLLLAERSWRRLDATSCSRSSAPAWPSGTVFASSVATISYQCSPGSERDGSPLARRSAPDDFDWRTEDQRPWEPNSSTSTGAPRPRRTPPDQPSIDNS